MSIDISVRDALALSDAQFIDVRSESEFSEATLPGALNIPLLRDAERAEVGTTYKYKGEQLARNQGLEFVSPRLPEIIGNFQELANKGSMVVFCWRGGMRSKSVASLLESVGIPVFRLAGGYKAYRKHVNDYLGGLLPHNVIVIHGLTGVGKTEVLQELRDIGEPAVDLEGLANNRGSVFGQIGLLPQPSQKMFDGLLVQELDKWEKAGYIIVECESRRIGRIILPDALMKSMREGIRILAFTSVAERIERIKRIYGADDTENREDLKSAILALAQRLGKSKVVQLIELLDQGHFDEVVQYLLVNYYDPLYRYPSQDSDEYDLCVDTTDVKNAARQVRDFLHTKS